MDRLTIQEFGATIKQKYPQYSGISDYEIGQKTLAKYPQYGEKVVKTFDVPETVETQPNKIARLQSEAQQAQAEAKKANSVGGFLGNFGKALVENIAPSEVGLGKTIAKTFGNQSDTYSKIIQDTNNQQANLLKAIREKEAKGGDTTSLKRIYNDNVKQLREVNKNLQEESNLPSTGEVVGQLGGTALDLLSAGTYSKAKIGLMTTGRLAPKFSNTLAKTATALGVPELGQIAKQTASGLFTKKGLGNAATGAGLGYANDVSMGLQGLRGEDRTGGNSLIPGLVTVIGTTIPVASELNQTRKNIFSPSKEKVDNAVNELENKYTEWSTGTKPGKKLVNNANKKTEMLNKSGTEGRTPMRVLAEDGVVPTTNGVKFDTFNQAEEYRKSTAPLREANKAALQEAGISTIPTDINTLEQRALQEARTPTNINSGRYDKMASEIRREFQLLRKNYPDGKISLGLQDDIKSARWDNVFKNKGLIDSDVLKKDSEYAIAKAFQKNIEEVASQAGHTEVAQLNREIGDKLEASKFLESLDGKVLKGGRVGKYVGTLIGSSLGQSIPGKIVGALGGNFVADKLIKASVTSPIRRAILSKLQKTDPEAYTMTLKWLAEQDTLRANRLQLPQGRFIPTGGITKEGYKVDALGNKTLIEGNGASVLPAQKNLVTNNPKTGKFQTSYNSQSKSPTIQQTIPATNSVSKNPILNTIQNNKSKVKSSAVDKSFLQSAKENLKKDGQAGFAKLIDNGYKETGDLTTKILKDLEGKTTVSKQYILDATNRGELKQAERDITRQVLETMPDGQINVKEFADKVKSELLPLKVETKKFSKNGGSSTGSTKYESIALPDELRGNVANYKENIYESPIATSAGDVHFAGKAKNYFGHTRIEDMADNKTRRVIEVQSDLYQKGNLEQELPHKIDYSYLDASKIKQKPNNGLFYVEDASGTPVKFAETKAQLIKDLSGEFDKKELKRISEVKKLQQYNDPTAHFRMVREEIKKASQDGKTKLQFPTGETAMKIEGLGERNNWTFNTKQIGGDEAYATLKPEMLEVGKIVDNGNPWIITDVLGDGKFKAVPKNEYIEVIGKNKKPNGETYISRVIDRFNRAKETFDISGKVDTNNPIYKFYEKDMGKYLKSKYNAVPITDNNGVTWYQVDIKPEYKEQPVLAFGKTKVGLLPKLAAGQTALLGGIYGASKLKNNQNNKKEETPSKKGLLINP